MDPIHFLQQLKKIHPNEEYTAKSRQVILGTAKKSRESMTLGRLLVLSFQSGSAIALAGLFLVLIFGGFALGKFFFFAPLQLSSLDPQSLKVEADSIDIQIELTHLQNYEDAGALTLSELSQVTTTPSTAAPMKSAKVKEEAKKLGIVQLTPATENVSVDDALIILSQ